MVILTCYYYTHNFYNSVKISVGDDTSGSAGTSTSGGGELQGTGLNADGSPSHVLVTTGE